MDIMSNMIFVCEHIMHDFTLGLYYACEYQRWYNKSNYPKCVCCSDVNEDELTINLIPVGSVEYIYKYFKKFNLSFPKPINVPEKLFPFCNRYIKNLHISGDYREYEDSDHFIKSNDLIKSYGANIGTYQISERIDIISEWRAFVYRNGLVGLCNYAGDFTLMPDIKKIEAMIVALEGDYPAYTLDVAICDMGLEPIEVHEFFSVGLYGFNDYRVLPNMFLSWYDSVINKY